PGSGVFRLGGRGLTVPAKPGTGRSILRLASSPKTARSASVRPPNRTHQTPHAAPTVQTGYIGGEIDRAHRWHLIGRGAGGCRALEIEHTDGSARRIREAGYAGGTRGGLVPRVRHLPQDRRQVQAAVQATRVGRPRRCVEGAEG